MDAFGRQMLLLADDYDPPPQADPGILEHRVPDPTDRTALADPATLAGHLAPGYVRRPHTDAIGAELAALERSWRHRQATHTLDRAAGHFDRLALNMPPQVGKTFTTVEWGAFWWLCLHPNHHIVIGSYGDSLAVKRGRAVRRLVVLYGHRFGLRLEKGTAAVKDWAVTLGGTVRSVGIGAGITGNPADIIFIDDPLKSRAEAESADRREKIYDWYSADILSRQSPGAPVVLLMTPWHPDDLRARVIASEGRVEDSGRWRVVIMPAFCTDPERDPLGRAEGDPLPHPKLPTDRAVLTAHWSQVKASVTVRDWAALWQCDPKPVEGALLSYKTIRERRCFESRERPCAQPATVAVAIDPSGGGRDVAGVVGGFLGVDGRLYWTHDRSGQMQPDEWGRAACVLAAEIGADRFVIERNYGGKMCTFVVRTAWEALRREDPDRYSIFVPRVVEVTARRGKLLRAEPIAQQVIEDRVRFGALLPEFEEEWATWRPGPTSPGRIDAGVHLAYELLPVPASGSPSTAGAMVMARTNLLPGFGGGYSR